MRIILSALYIILLNLGIMAWASSVSTTDGVNLAVTNDSGTTANMLENDIQTKIDQANIAVSQDNQRKAQDQVQLLTDQETEDIWIGVNAQATNAISQVNGYTVPLTTDPNAINWTDITDLHLQGLNWSSIQAIHSGVNWTAVNIANGTSGVNWPGINWNVISNCLSNGVNWNTAVINGTC